VCLFITQELRGFLLVSTTPTILISISNEFSRSVSLILIVIYETGCGSARISSTENQIYHPSVHNWTMLHHYVGSASDSVPNGSVPTWNETWIVLSTRTMICRFYSRNLLFFWKIVEIVPGKRSWQLQLPILPRLFSVLLIVDCQKLDSSHYCRYCYCCYYYCYHLLRRRQHHLPRSMYRTHRY